MSNALKALLRFDGELQYTTSEMYNSILVRVVPDHTRNFGLRLGLPVRVVDHPIGDYYFVCETDGCMAIYLFQVKPKINSMIDST